jgi:hypothetical protein
LDFETEKLAFGIPNEENRTDKFSRLSSNLSIEIESKFNMLTLIVFMNDYPEARYPGNENGAHKSQNSQPRVLFFPYPEAFLILRKTLLRIRSERVTICVRMDRETSPWENHVG